MHKSTRAFVLTPWRRCLVVSALVALTGVSLPGAAAERRPRLSADLVRILGGGRQTRGPERVIVHGTRQEIDALVGRYGLEVLRRLADGAAVSGRQP